MYNHTEPTNQMTKPTKKGMKRNSPKAKPKNTIKKPKMKAMGKAKKTISY
tara:strand:- start:329 stop:478 length:150 start_codon:yes stop_codon:yes gene_type:complete